MDEHKKPARQDEAERIAEKLIYSPAEGCDLESTCAVDWNKHKESIVNALRAYGLSCREKALEDAAIILDNCGRKSKPEDYVDIAKKIRRREEGK